ncbi:Heavy metal-associated domain, HMA [Cynara cardunculus var. scolymus]|uniref:Heavy metal-associated domain, HMA n=1 Tax=Cynara cardunculus var. scolymus TaxID=59895 RepID=A0A103XKP1_CYNCS|nr:Heavy metal-associated domain, HMA [Cynara cardunculus var. scolymus]
MAAVAARLCHFSSSSLSKSPSDSLVGLCEESRNFLFSKVERVDVIQSDGEDEVLMEMERGGSIEVEWSRYRPSSSRSSEMTFFFQIQMHGFKIQIHDTSEMTTTTVDLQIIPLHNCTKCIRRVETTLCRFDGVKLLDVDSENGKFTIETTRHPEEIRDALQRKFAGKFVFLSKRINHSNPFSTSLVFDELQERVRERVEKETERCKRLADDLSTSKGIWTAAIREVKDEVGVVDAS